MDQSSFHFHEKKRVVVKIGSSSLNYEETGSLNFTKLEHLVRELCNLRNRGMDVCLVSSGAIAVGRQSLGMTERPQHRCSVYSEPGYSGGTGIRQDQS